MTAEEIERDAPVDLARRLARCDLKIREIDLPHAPPRSPRYCLLAELYGALDALSTRIRWVRNQLDTSSWIELRSAGTSHMTGLDWTMIAAYFGVFAALTWWTVLRSRQTAADYFLAGRDLT